MTSYEAVQEGLFFLEYKMHYSPDDINNMKYHVIQKRVQQFIKYKKEMNEAISNSLKKAGK